MGIFSDLDQFGYTPGIEEKFEREKPNRKALKPAPQPRSKPHESPTPLKSLLFLRNEIDPERLASLDTKWCIADLEDSVEENKKASARRWLSSLLERGVFHDRGLLIRVNGMDHPEAAIEDLRHCLHPDVDMLILPMLESARDVRRFDELVSLEEKRLEIENGSIEFICLLERPAAILAANEIVSASPRVKAVALGHADFLAELGGIACDDTLGPARSAVVMAARARRLPAIASPFLDFNDPRGFQRECEKMRELGFTGIFTIHPNQEKMARRIFSPSAREESEARELLGKFDERGGVLVHKGKMAGPPMLAQAREILRRADSSSGPQAPISVVQGRIPHYGLELSNASIGQIMECPAEITIDEGWRTLWQASFPSASRIHSSSEYARAWGLEDTALPFGMLLNLTLCLAVEPFSESCRLHLGLEDARQEARAKIGDTFRGYVRIESMANTSRNDASVIRTTHILINQKGERVFSLIKDSYYDLIPTERAEFEPQTASADAHLFDASPSRAHRESIENCSRPPEGPRSPLSEGEVILHPSVRPIGISENLLLTTLFRNTHPVHSDTMRFGSDGLIVCGGFVQALAQACSERDLRPILEERLERSHHINPVAPGERIGAISRVLEVRSISQHLEEVRVHTLGLREVDVIRELGGKALPAQLFNPAAVKPSEIQELCHRHCPELEDKIALRSLRTLIRPRS